MKKYLTHELIQLKAYGNDFKCKICGVMLYQFFGKYYLIYPDDTTENIMNFQLTCDEWIIKNILE